MRIVLIANKQVFILVVFFFVLTSIITFPLLFKINSAIPGFSSTDEPYAALWHFWWMKHAQLRRMPLSQVDAIAAPFGVVSKPGYAFWNFLNKWLVYFTHPILAYNLQVIFSYILSGVFTYYLAWFVIKKKAAALFSALIFTFCPYHSVRSWQHLGLAFIQWMPLYVLALLKLDERKSLRNALWVGVTYSLVAAFDLYYTYFIFLVTLLFIFFAYLRHKSVREGFRLVKFLLLSCVIIVIFEARDMYYIWKFIHTLQKVNAGAGVYGYIRPFDDLFFQSGRPLSYLLPAVFHPLLGKFTEGFIGSPFYGGSLTEHTLFLGWVPLLFAFIAVKRWRREKKGFQSLVSRLKSKESFYLSLFFILAIVAWLLSQPPWWKIGPIKIYMPSFFMYKVAPMFRAYCRFGIVVMLAIAVLAGFGLRVILEKFKTKRIKIAVATLFCGLVLFEFWNYPPFKVIDVSRVPEVYYWLKEQPGDFAIAEYPLDADTTNELYKFYQTKHEKKIINGTIPGTYANKVAQTIKKLSEPKTAGRLKGMGVRYALVHRDGYLETELIEEKEELNKIPRNHGLKLIKTFPPQECPQKDIMCVQKTGLVNVYEVAAEPIRPEVER